MTDLLETQPAIPVAKLKKNAEYHGICIGHNASGQALIAIELETVIQHVHVDPRQTVPGDKVRVRVLRTKTGEARILSITEASNNRRNPVCIHFGTCGGCSLQHLPYDLQLQAKLDMIAAAFSDAPLSFQPIIGCSEELYYRNKLEYTFSSRVFHTEKPLEGAQPLDETALGFFVPFSGNKVLDLQVCHLQGSPDNAVRTWARHYAQEHHYSFYHSTRHEGELRTLLIRTSSLGQCLVMVVFGHCLQERIDSFMSALVMASGTHFPAVQSIYYCINQKLNDSYADLVPVHVHGESWIDEVLDGLTFRSGPLSFMQVNPKQTLTLYQRIMELAEIQVGDLVWDLYCGAGTISAFAARLARKVIGIEYVEQAVEHARAMATTNQLDNTLFFAGDMKDLLNIKFVEAEGCPDVIICDPPRAGLHPAVAQLLCSLQPLPRRLVYVSCKPASLARDIQLLSKSYKVFSAQAIDLMPQTIHIEIVAVFEPL